MKISKLLSFALLAALTISCSKDDDTPGLVNPSIPGDLKGTLFYDWATEGTLAVNTQTGVKSEFLPTESKRNGWDLSRDGQVLLTASKKDIWSDDVTLVMSNVSDGAVIKELKYTPLNGGSGFNSGKLSPDNSMIVLNSTFEEGFVILDTEGNVVTHLYDVQGEKIDMNEQAEWLPDNSLVLTHKNYIIKLSPPYTNGQLVKEMNFEDWGNLAVDPTGSKIAVRVGNHIHMMNMDGSGFVQVTDSNDKEAYPVFSPDGKYLLVGTDYTRTGSFGAIWYLKIIPADGQLYNVDPIYENSPEVIPVITNGETKIETASGRMVWR